MTDIQLCDYLRDFLTLTPPADVTTLTVSAISGNSIQLSGSVGDSDAWVGCVLEVTQEDSPAYRSRLIIMGNSGSVVITSTQFNKNKMPNFGDTVTITGGPLAQARVYLFEPDSIDSAVQSGVKYFVVINCTGGEVTQVTLGTKDRAVHNSESVYGIEVSAETLDITGAPTTDDVYRVALELPTLKQQLLCLIHWYRNQASTNMTGRGSIEYVYLSYQRTGSPTRLRGAVMKFDIAVR